MNIAKVNDYNNRLFQGNYSYQRQQPTQDKTEEEKSIYGGNLRLGEKEDEYLASLMQQLEKNKRDIQELSSNQEMTPEVKKEKLKELQLQQKEIQNQITQRNIELAEEERKKTQEEIEKQLKNSISAKTPEELEKKAKLAKSNALTTASLAMEEISNLSRTKVKLEGEKKVAEAELKMAMSYQGAATDGKADAVADTSQALSKVTSEISKALKQAEDAINKGKEAEEERIKAKNLKEDEEEKVKKTSKEQEEKQVMFKHVDIEL